MNSLSSCPQQPRHFTQDTSAMCCVRKRGKNKRDLFCYKSEILKMHFMILLLDYSNFLPNANVGCLRYQQINKGKRNVSKKQMNLYIFMQIHNGFMNLFRSISQAVKPKVPETRKQWVEIKIKWEISDKNFKIFNHKWTYIIFSYKN